MGKSQVGNSAGQGQNELRYLQFHSQANWFLADGLLLSKAFRVFLVFPVCCVLLRYLVAGLLIFNLHRQMVGEEEERILFQLLFNSNLTLLLELFKLFDRLIRNLVTRWLREFICSRDLVLLLLCKVFLNLKLRWKHRILPSDEYYELLNLNEIIPKDFIFNQLFFQQILNFPILK